jgi:hypothetical protein
MDLPVTQPLGIVVIDVNNEMLDAATRRVLAAGDTHRQRTGTTSSSARTCRPASGRKMTRRLVGRRHAALSPGGYLLLAHSESLWQMDGLMLVEHDGIFCYCNPSPAHDLQERVALRRAVLSDVVFGDCSAQCFVWRRPADSSRAQRKMEAFIETHPASAHLRLGMIAARRELDSTREFAADPRPAPIVDFCRNRLERQRGTW